MSRYIHTIVYEVPDVGGGRRIISSFSWPRNDQTVDYRHMLAELYLVRERVLRGHPINEARLEIFSRLVRVHEYVVTDLPQASLEWTRDWTPGTPSDYDCRKVVDAKDQAEETSG